jgi:hypothetical protein
LGLRNGIRRRNIGVCSSRDEKKGVASHALEELLLLYKLGAEANELRGFKTDLSKRKAWVK